MDVGSWSWKWRVAGGVAVAVVTPYCGKTLLQINREARENCEVVAPWLVQYVRENYGEFVCVGCVGRAWSWCVFLSWAR